MTSRKYPQKDVKLLYGLAAARCAFTECRKVCAANATDVSEAVPLGRIAHIYAHADEGPRANSSLTLGERDSYANWILLCADCHDVIDKQPESYSADYLIELKGDHEGWVLSRLQESVPEVSFTELEIVCRAVLANPVSPTANFTLIRPEDKIKKNNLSDRIADRITIGLIKAKEVNDFVADFAKRVPDFPERLSHGFVTKYDELKTQGLDGDALFEELHLFASSNKTDFGSQSAGLSVLVYLFEKCEVFEK